MSSKPEVVGLVCGAEGSTGADQADALTLPKHPQGATLMDFSEALKWLKNGDKATRNAWESHGQYVVLQPGRTEPAEPHIDMPAPDGVMVGRWLRYEPFLMMISGGICVPWQPTVNDLLAVDWLHATSDGRIAWPDGTVA